METFKWVPIARDIIYPKLKDRLLRADTSGVLENEMLMSTKGSFSFCIKIDIFQIQSTRIGAHSTLPDRYG